MKKQERLYGWANLHRHNEFSTFDGFGKQKWAAKHAAQMGQTALGISEHGSVSGLIEHYQACIANEIKPILGCEVYFQPKFNPDKKYYHMCLFCKDLVGYKNLMKMISIANEQNFYRVAIITGELLKKYHEGIICTTACIGGYPSKALMQGKKEVARKRLKQLYDIFGDDFYVELMPYSVISEGKDLQYDVDIQLLELIEEEGYKGIITTDSHYIYKDDYETFKIMFKIAGKKFDNDYSQRYMPTEKDVANRFKKMYGKNPVPFLKNTAEIVEKCNVKLEFDEMLPKMDWGMPSKQKLKELVKEGLIKKQKVNAKGKIKKKYKERALYELDVIFTLGFEDYFLLCYDIVAFAKRSKIGYGPGRGSVCGSLVAYALGITQVDPLKLGTLFERFLRKDKKKMPDIDMDFCSNRRHEIIEYINTRHAGRATQVATYGYYKVNNLINDLAKVLEMEKDEIATSKEILLKLYPELMHGTDVEYDEIIQDDFMAEMEEKYRLVTHFSKLCGQIRYIGKHAGGVAIAATDLSDTMATIRLQGKLQSCYDLNSLEFVKVLKMDILGLAAVSVCNELEEQTGVLYDDFMLDDEEVLEEFYKANTCGIFQFEKSGAIDVLQKIKPDGVQDLIAATALNRPTPLQMGMPTKFAEAKENGISKSIISEFLEDTYGCLVYQESIIKICRGIADLEWPLIDKLIKGLKSASFYSAKLQDEVKIIRKKFIKQAKAKHPEIDKQELVDLFDEMSGGYLFNKGHGAGYSLISIQEMYYKHYYPIEFWATILRNENDERKRVVYESEATKAGCIILPIHMNGTAQYNIVEYGGGKCISRGLATTKGIGPKAGEEIEANGPYFDRADFEEKVSRRICNARVMRIMEENDAFEVNEKKRYYKVLTENKYLASKSLQIR